MKWYDQIETYILRTYEKLKMKYKNYLRNTEEWLNKYLS